jgi:hypothetical protein
VRYDTCIEYSPFLHNLFGIKVELILGKISPVNYVFLGVMGLGLRFEANIIFPSSTCCLIGRFNTSWGFA